MTIKFETNVLLVIGGVVFIVMTSYNQIHTTGLFDVQSLVKDGVSLWFMAQSLIAHRSNLDGTKIVVVDKTDEKPMD
jgi:ABC-type thiamin/hydroxymethylpyrimidine transport system permease subunit